MTVADEIIEDAVRGAIASQLPSAPFQAIPDSVHFSRAISDIHGAYPDLDLYVFTYRDPANFFESVDVSLVAGNPALGATLADLKRHDRVRIEVAGHGLPQPRRPVRQVCGRLLHRTQW
jgi:hypothetical protein